MAQVTLYRIAAASPVRAPCECGICLSDRDIVGWRCWTHSVGRFITSVAYRERASDYRDRYSGVSTNWHK